jgi:hypothetical protein
VAAFPTTPNEQLHVYYLQINSDHVYQLFYNGATWSDEDLTALSGGKPAHDTSAVVGFPVGNYQYVFFVGSDSHVHQLLYNNANWTDTDLTVIGGGTFAYTANLVAFTTSPALHVYYIDFGQHIHQLFATNGTNWQDQDLTNLTGAGLAVLSDLNGLELSKRIRAAHSEMKILFVTGFGEQFPELRKYGTDILEKPFLPSEILRKVDDILNQGKSATGTGP